MLHLGNSNLASILVPFYRMPDKFALFLRFDFIQIIQRFIFE